MEKRVLEYAEMEMKDYIDWGPSVHGGFYRDFGTYFNHAPKMLYESFNITFTFGHLADAPIQSDLQ